MMGIPDIDPEDLICRCGRHKPCRHCEDEPGVELAPEKNSDFPLASLRREGVASARNQTTPMKAKYHLASFALKSGGTMIVLRESTKHGFTNHRWIIEP